MAERKRIKVILTISFVSIVVLYIVSEYVYTRDYVSFSEDDYISQFLLSTESKKVAKVEVAEATKTSFYYNHKLVNFEKTDSDKNINKPNITITILTTEDAETTFKVSYLNVTPKTSRRNVFVEMRDINKTTENIFFIESRCATEKMAIHFKGNKGMVLNPRQCCAIESTAHMNLDHNVYLFHSCSLDDEFFKHSPKFVEKLFEYPNIYVVRLNTTEAFLNTPLEELHRTKLLETSQYPVEHTSDLLRLTLLWKFGGTYSDLDVVTIRSLNNLKTNWAGMQDEVTIANGVINFEPAGVGHRMLQRALEHVNKHYEPFSWSSNGPLLITPIILQECRVQKVIEAQQHCNGSFMVYNSSVLYPVFYPYASYFFDNNLGQKIVNLVKSNSYSVHIWNKMSHDLVITVGSTQAYAVLADEYCPQVYKNCGPRF